MSERRYNQSSLDDRTTPADYFEQARAKISGREFLGAVRLFRSAIAELSQCTQRHPIDGGPVTGHYQLLAHGFIVACLREHGLDSFAEAEVKKVQEFATGANLIFDSYLAEGTSKVERILTLAAQPLSDRQY